MMLMMGRTAFSLAKRTGSASHFAPLLVFLLLFLPTLSLAQGPDTLWTRAYRRVGDQIAASVRQATDGGYMIAGSMNDSLGGDYDFYLIKTNDEGDTSWTRTYGGDSDDVCASACQTRDGGYILAGFTDSFGQGARNPYVIKTDMLGDTVWTRAYGGDEAGAVNSVCQTNDGGYIFAGYTSSLLMGQDIYLIRTNGNGDTLWTRSYGISSLFDNEVATDVRQVADSGFVVAGTSTQTWPGEQHIYMVRTDGSGDTLWTRIFGGEDDQTASVVIQTRDGGYFLVGNATRDYLQDIYAMKTDSQGNRLWEFRHDGGSDREGACGALQTSDGGFVIAGGSNVYGAIEVYSLLIKINELGDTLWTHKYILSYPQIAVSFQGTQDSGYIIGGTMLNVESFEKDIFLMKTRPDLSDAPMIHPVTVEGFALHQNFPNPFNASTRITFKLPTTSPVSLKVYDLLGREVANLMDGMRTPGHYSISFDGSNLPSGIYIYRIETGSLREAKKMILLK
jgi:hypothetical protein